MMKLAALSVLGLFVAGVSAQAQTIVKISPDRKTVVATSEKGTATTHVTRDGNGSCNSMGSGGYRPTGR